MNKYYPILFIFFLIVSSLQAQEIRTWTNTEGKTVNGSIVKKTATTVSLKLENGKTAQIPLTQLCDEDRSYINDWQEKNIESTDTPAKNDPAKETADVKSHFDKSWPQNIRVPIEQEVKLVAEKDGMFVYETAHFRFFSDAQISLRLMRALSCIFEATFEANCALPLNFFCNEYKKNTDEKFPVRFYEKKEDFYNETAVPKNIAGVYFMGTVHVPFENLGMRKMGKNYTIDREANPSTLIHEITHQMTLPFDPEQPTLLYPIWFAEGIAEYVSQTPYKSGNFSFGLTKAFLLEYATVTGKKNKGGRFLGTEFSVPPLQTFMNQSHRQFMAGNDHLNYGFSALLAYYFFHIDGKGDAARIKKYLEALQKGEPLPQANKALLDGRSWEELEKDIAEGMRKALKLKVNFQT